MTAQELILTNAHVVLRDDEFNGSVVVRDSKIAEIDDGRSGLSAAVDCEGDYLLPGLIEMHTDNMEKHFVPRPKTHWPYPMAAAIAHDTQIIGAGITTVLDAMAVGEYDAESMRRQLLGEAIAAIKHGRKENYFRSEHLIHLRCEVADPFVVEIFEPHKADPLLKLVSVMDHTPGQRQYRDVEQMAKYYRGKKWTEEKIESYFQGAIENQKKYSAKHRKEIVALCRAANIPLASHDDTDIEHVEESAAEGMVIAEFPITLPAATRARELGMGTIMGAPNVVRGGSHSGNIAALEVAREGQLDGLSSDYVPAALLHAAFLLHEQAPMPLPEAVAKVSANVADMLGLDDRGRIAHGLKADLVRVRHTEQAPLVRSVWRDGERMM